MREQWAVWQHCTCGGRVLRALDDYHCWSDNSCPAIHCRPDRFNTTHCHLGSGREPARLVRGAKICWTYWMSPETAGANTDRKEAFSRTASSVLSPSFPLPSIPALSFGTNWEFRDTRQGQRCIVGCTISRSGTPRQLIILKRFSAKPKAVCYYLKSKLLSRFWLDTLHHRQQVGVYMYPDLLLVGPSCLWQDIL